MRLVETPPARFGHASVDHVVDAAYSEATVRQVYGADARIGAWSGRGVRRVHLQLVKPEGAPLGAQQDRSTLVSATLTQRVVRNLPESARSRRLHEVHGSIRLHMLGAELFRIRPRTVVTVGDDGVGAQLRTSVEIHAVLPPPLCGLLEDMMARRATEELGRYADAITHALARVHE